MSVILNFLPEIANARVPPSKICVLANHALWYRIYPSVLQSFYRLVFDLINILQGVIIFVVFVCRRAVLIRVCEVTCGQAYAKKKFPSYYNNTDIDLPNNEIKHSVV